VKQRVGIVSDATQTGTGGTVEARFNTLTQDGTRIDGLVDLWLLNATDPSKYVRVGLFGSGFSHDRAWDFASSVDGSFAEEGVNYTNDTWYRVRIDATAGNLSVSLWNDAGTTELKHHDFSHNLATLGDTFRVGLGQFLGTTNGNPFTTDSAVDWVSADLSVPEPSTLALGLVGLIGLAAFRRMCKRR
jgi:hypothetical protein